MIIKYKRKMLKFNLIIGLFWIVIGIIGLVIGTTPFFQYGYIVIGLLYLISYTFQKHYQYLTITDSSITKHGVKNKTLHFSEINRVKYYAGEYTLFTETKKLTINKELVDPSSLEALELAIEEIKP